MAHALKLTIIDSGFSSALTTVEDGPDLNKLSSRFFSVPVRLFELHEIILTPEERKEAEDLDTDQDEILSQQSRLCVVNMDIGKSENPSAHLSVRTTDRTLQVEHTRIVAYPSGGHRSHCVSATLTIQPRDINRIVVKISVDEDRVTYAIRDPKFLYNACCLIAQAIAEEGIAPEIELNVTSDDGHPAYADAGEDAVEMWRQSLTGAIHFGVIASRIEAYKSKT